MRVSFVRGFAIAAVAALGLAACGSSSKSSSGSAATTVAPTVASTEAPTTTAGGGASGATVALAANSKVDGKMILVDSKGMTLYVWDKDTTPGQSTCDASAQCAAAWPAFYVTGTPTYGTGLTASMFSTITAPNGQKQLAVNGKPLYYWVNDKAAGQATGQNVNGFYVVAANGNKIDAS